MQERRESGHAALHVILKSQRVAFESKGYTALFPGATQSQLGFAYPVVDADSDGLADAAE